MSRSVDDRVVQMQFDNQKFERNVQQSLGTLEKLKSALDFGKSEKNMASLERSFQNFDLSSFGNNLQKIADRFSFMGIVGDQVIRKLTDAFMGLTGQVTNLVKSMTFDQVTAGWGKYADKTASVQTIMNATGKSIDEVNGYLNKLMWFADETSYGFTDMTSALGQLTTAGGDIESLIPMIEGIANATAYAGKGPAEFSRAIYNLNQSYSSGALKYMDWKSLELAGVASKELKQTFIDTAVAMGKISKGQVTIGNFSQTLKDDWADTEVMEAAFGKFGQVTEEAYKLVQEGKFDTASEAYASLAGQFDDIYYKAARSAQEAKSFAEVIEATKDAVSSGWMKTFELIFGNYEEAKVLWTDMANSFWEIFASGADSRNELLKEWHDAEVGGYSDFTEAINNFLEAIISAKNVLSEIVSGILPGLDVSNLTGFTQSFKQLSVIAKNFFSGELTEEAKEFTQTIGIGGAARYELEEYASSIGETQNKYRSAKTAGEQFKNGIAGIVHLVNIARKGFLTLRNSLSPIGKVFKAVSNSSLKVFDAFGHLFDLLDRSINITDGFKDSIEGVANKIADFVTNSGNKISDFIYKTFKFDSATGKIKILSESFDGLKEKLGIFKENTYIKNFLDTINGIKDGVSFVAREGFGALSKIPSILPTIISLLSKVGGAILSVSGFIGRMLSKVNDLTKSGSILSTIGDIFIKSLKQIGILLTPVWNGLKHIFDLLSSGDFAGFKNLMSGIFSGAGAFGVLSLAKSGKGFLGSLTGIGTAISGILDRFKSQEKTSKTIINIALALGVLTGSLLLLSSLDVDKIVYSTTALGILFGELLGFMTALKALSGPTVVSGRGGFMEKIFGKKTVNSFSSIDGISKMLIKLSAAMMIFSVSLKILSSINVDGMKVALVGMGGMFAILSGFLAILNSITKEKGLKGLKGLGSALKSIAVSMVIFGAAMKIFATMSWEDLAKGGVAIAGILGALIGLFAAIGSFKALGSLRLASIGVSLLAISTSLVILAAAMKIFATMSWEDLAKGGVAIAGFFAILAIFGAISTKVGIGLIAGAAALMLIAPSLLLITGIIAALGALKLENIGKALLAIGGTMLILAASLSAMTYALPGAAALMVASIAIMALVPSLAILGALPLKNIGKALLALAGAFAVIGLGALILSPISPILLAVSVALLAFGAAVALAGAGFTLFGTGMAIMAASGIAGAYAIIEALQIIIKGIGELGSEIVNTVAVVVGSIVEGLVMTIPQIVEGIGTVLLAVLTYLDEHGYELFDKVISLLLQLMQVIRDRIPELVDVAVEAVIALIEGIATALDEHSGELADAIIHVFESIVNAMLMLLEKVFEKIPIVGEALASGIRTLRTGVDQNNTSQKEKSKGGKGIYTRGHTNSTNNSVENVKESKKSILEEFNDDDYYDQIREINKKVPESEANGILDGKDLPVNAATELKSDTANALQFTDLSSFVENGKAIASSEANGIRDGKDLPVNAATELKADTSKALKFTDLSSFAENGKAAVNSSAKGISDATPYAVGVARTHAAKIRSEFSSQTNLYSDGKETAENWGKGFAAGCDKMSRQLIETARGVANTIVEHTRRTLKINSPSVVASEIGMYWDMGLSRGMEKYSHLIDNSSKTTSSALIHNIQSAVNSATGMLNKAAETYDDITPVLGLDNNIKDIRRLGTTINNQNDSRVSRALKRDGPINNPQCNETKTTNYGGFTVNITAAPGQNGKELARQFMDELQLEIERKEAALA